MMGENTDSDSDEARFTEFDVSELSMRGRRVYWAFLG